jgi:hypothetical protein
MITYSLIRHEDILKSNGMHLQDHLNHIGFQNCYAYEMIQISKIQVVHSNKNVCPPSYILFKTNTFKPTI